MLVEYDIEAGKVFTTFPTFTLTVIAGGSLVTAEDEQGRQVAEYDTHRCGSNAECLLAALARLCDDQALTATRGAA